MTANELLRSSPTSLELRRVFDATCERVFDAWLSPDAMRIFLGGESVKVIDIAVDPRIGGSYSITWETAQGPWTVRGTYREIVKNERIVCTWAFDEDDPGGVHESLLRLEFRPLGDKTELVLTHTNLRDEKSRDGHSEGWESSFDKLAQQLEPPRNSA